MESRPQKLLDRVREAIRLKHYSYRTEESYIAWICRLILFHQKRYSKDVVSIVLCNRDCRPRRRTIAPFL